MKYLCVWGIHRWIAKIATRNSARIVQRCARCRAVKVTLLRPRPSPVCLIRDRIHSAKSDADPARAWVRSANDDRGEPAPNRGPGDRHVNILSPPEAPIGADRGGAGPTLSSDA